MTASTSVDLRSDTVTRPTPAMRAAMAAAPLGDDVFGDDPSVNALQEKIAAMLGLRGGAVRAHRHAEQPVRACCRTASAATSTSSARWQHCYRWEGGGAAVFGSVQPQPLDHQPDGTLALADIEAAIKPDDRAFRAHPAAGAGEHAGRQGAAVRLPASRRRRWRARKGLATPPRRRAALQRRGRPGRQASAADPRAKRAASRAASTASRSASARASARRSARRCAARANSSRAPAASARWPAARMRQAGVLAAAAVVCARPPCRPPGAGPCAGAAAGRGAGRHRRAEVEAPQTNILFVDLAGAARSASAELLAHLAREGVLATGLYRLRFVTHLDVDAAGVDRAVAAIRRFFQA